MKILTFSFSALVLSAGLSFAEIGKDWGVEREAYVDSVTGVRILEITKRPSASDNLYYHFSNFTADNRYLIFVSDRTGSTEIFRYEIEGGQIIQLTHDPKTKARSACPDHTNASLLYYLRGPEVVALNIVNLTQRTVGMIPKPFVGGFQQPTLNADGTFLTVTKQKDEFNWEIGLMSTKTGEYRTVISQGFRIGHVQHSPVDPVIFYVWETGGYAPQRTWLVNTDGTGNRPFYVRTDPKTWFTPQKEWVTHEAWVKETGNMTMINDKQGVMLVRPDGSTRMIREGHFWHVAARPDGKYLVLDDMRDRLWLMETATGNTRLLATGIRDQVRSVHAHASFDRKGHYIQFHSGKIHETISLIDLRSLPPIRWN